MKDVETTYRQAQEAVAAARYNLQGGFLRTTANRAYYAANYAARAALLTVGESPKTHRGAIRQFALHVVKSGRIDPQIAGAFP